MTDSVIHKDQAQLLAEKIAQDKVTTPETLPSIPDLATLDAQHADADAETFLRAMIDEFDGRIALVSSFGAESAVLLDLVARVKKDLPVIFLETGMHFAQTLTYRNKLIKQLGLTNVQSVTPDPADLAEHDADESLWQWDTDQCCHIRKVLPLQKALSGYDAWINGRKQMHGGLRVRLPRLELSGGHIKVNPLAWWTRDDVEAAFESSGLPRHPLVEQGYPSIGCWPCTQPVDSDDDVRGGRWNGQDKTECGIHVTMLRSQA